MKSKNHLSKHSNPSLMLIRSCTSALCPLEPANTKRALCGLSTPSSLRFLLSKSPIPSSTFLVRHRSRPMTLSSRTRSTSAPCLAQRKIKPNHSSRSTPLPICTLGAFQTLPRFGSSATLHRLRSATQIICCSLTLPVLYPLLKCSISISTPSLGPSGTSLPIPRIKTLWPKSQFTPGHLIYKPSPPTLLVVFPPNLVSSSKKSGLGILAQMPMETTWRAWSERSPMR
ncbi:hypothetical protein P153DRAFT_199020 [Dothidotthia symphoricarpi CBS 119687]|uniref:Uncharacterized protein n=1 Tax=Dothidotthia symphoricarpi CBS 119687 TaxID=1392245 RepID=A0A6A6AKE7_9PLEO|nr:uncharacterized protein P153DRAFT_199020 [Dothidotthia symphoricarpi CBS 119687]KAF2131588.1 hypothetical protein P153DRAFT_199020 [Dothidotthia symphoricarpi CBS 119687]